MNSYSRALVSKRTLRYRWRPVIALGYWFFLVVWRGFKCWEDLKLRHACVFVCMCVCTCVLVARCWFVIESNTSHQPIPSGIISYYLYYYPRLSFQFSTNVSIIFPSEIRVASSKRQMESSLWVAGWLVRVNVYWELLKAWNNAQKQSPKAEAASEAAGGRKSIR